MAATNEQLKVVSNLAAQQVAAEEEVARIEQTLKEAKAHLSKIQEDLLPSAMQECGLEDFTTTDGQKVSIKNGITASISKKFQDVAFGWLKQQGHDDIIKNEVTAVFGRGEDGQARQTIEYLSSCGVPYKNKKLVHTSTLRAFCAEQISKGVNIPHDIFGIYEWRKAIIKSLY